MSRTQLREENPVRARAAKRITGLDAARGLALIGMMAIHVMPNVDDSLEPTVVWTIASGISASLFALLAGVGLALGSRSGPHDGPRALKAARASLALRAATIAGIGLLLGQMEIPAFIILSYYGVMFALSIPLLGLGARALAACAAGFATVGALSSWALADALPNLGEYDPSLYFLVSDPGGTLSALLFTGAYPAIPWMAFVCAGLALGKMDLRSLDIQLRIFLTGLSLALGTALLSALLLGPLGGKDALLSSMRGRGNEAALQEALTWGPIESTPVGSGWWQVALSPYSNTVFELLNTLGVALAVFAAMLFISGRISWAVAPLAQVGSMTLTLYTGHLLFLATGIWEASPAFSLWVQLAAGLLFALLWKNVTGLKRGPLEHVVALVASGARERVLAAPERQA